VTTGCLTVLTDKITYRPGDFDSTFVDYGVFLLKLIFTVRNNLDLKANLYGCDIFIGPGVQKKLNGEWSLYLYPIGCGGCRGDMICSEFVRVEVFSGQTVQDSIWSGIAEWKSIDQGQYRLFIPYSVGPYLGGPLPDSLYSNEFEIVE
jgi:hypothetical protein